MIKLRRVEELVEEKISETDQFVVEIKVNPKNEILILLDTMNGSVSVSDCMAVSRWVERNIDREEEDYKLEVSSPGLDKPFKVKKQFSKNVGRQVIMKLNDAREIKGELLTVDQELVEIKTKEKVKIGKKKQWQEAVEKINFDEIEEAKVVISFK